MKALLTLAAITLTHALSFSAPTLAAEGSRAGTLKWYNADKGYGFLKGREAVEFVGNEFYFRAQSVTNYPVLVDALLAGLGQPVCATFDLVKVPRTNKVEAVNVTFGPCL